VRLSFFFSKTCTQTIFSIKFRCHARQMTREEQKKILREEKGIKLKFVMISFTEILKCDQMENEKTICFKRQRIVCEGNEWMYIVCIDFSNRWSYRYNLIASKMKESFLLWIRYSVGCQCLWECVCVRLPLIKEAINSFPNKN
jgi:hypothetical protein